MGGEERDEREKERKTNCREGVDKSGWCGPAADAAAAGEDGSRQSRDGAARSLFCCFIQVGSPEPQRLGMDPPVPTPFRARDHVHRRSWAWKGEERKGEEG